MEQDSFDADVEFIPPELCSRRTWTEPVTAGPTTELVPVERPRPAPEADLIYGNVVVTGPVHSKIRGKVSDDEEEFATVRYSALTCEPAMFEKERFTLRQKLYISPRRTELLITVPLCGKSGTDLGRTLTSIFANIQFICDQKAKMWKRRGWKKCVVCILADGRSRLTDEAKAALSLLGLWQPALAVHDVGGKKVLAHLFEHTTRVRLRGGTIHPVPEYLETPVQMILCLNESRQGMEDCDRWLTEAIMPELDPRMCVFVPAGVMPSSDAIYRLWERLDLHPRCWGAVGRTDMGASVLTWALNPLAAAHGMQLKLQGLLDNPLQSFMGFAPVLPIQLSIFRCKQEMVKCEETSPGDLEDGSIRARSMPSAWHSCISDRRRWAFGVLSQYRSRYRLDYVCKAKAHVPAPSFREYLIRRQNYMQDRVTFVINALSTMRSIAGIFRKFKFMILLVYLCLELIFSWFAIGNTFLVFFFINHYFTSESIIGQHGSGTETAILTLYSFLLAISTLCGLSHQPRSRRLGVVRALITAGWMLLAVYLLAAIIVVAVKTTKPTFHDMMDAGMGFHGWFSELRFFIAILPLVAIYAIWLLTSLLFLDPWIVLTASIQHVLCILVHVNFMNISAFMYTGTSASELGQQDASKDEKAPPTNYSFDHRGRIKVNSDNDEDLDNAYVRIMQDLEDRKGQDLQAAKLPPSSECGQGVYPEKVVIGWAWSNLVLCAVILNTLPSVRHDSAGDELRNINTGASTLYLLIVFWALGCLEAVKFCGALLYIIKEAIYFF
ncbi:uncharacterized protein DSM5745_01835 [Aspergillus mulundensis]|uniref:Chitin synthase n=1 Tax=Aspergillus mulundensis TaxID=1810919 RepID=A0A3D8SUU1_9EURO|nr:Uncharacterized protein DSM5745_01835 [Aspergillus mulundensis]RDW90060.1 Uncharacterized protein DSM5745_01835 [Aspergillus mulundensis]